MTAFLFTLADRIGTYPTNNFQVYTSGASGVAEFAYNPPLNTWTYICGVISSTAATTLYVNGKIFGSAGTGGGVLQSNTLNDTSPFAPFVIGASGSAGEFFNGYIDNVSLYGEALVASNIGALYAESTPSHVNLAMANKEN